MTQLRDAFRIAVRNIAKWGDTDVFPLPPENLVFHDHEDDVISLLGQLHADLDSWSDVDPPENAEALSMVGYTSFRWVTQIDPLWNAYLLGLTIAIAPEIEAARIPREQRVVFSYRFDYNKDEQRLFADSAWRDFNLRSVELADNHSYVVACDIADFYSRVYHHRLENALLDLKLGADFPRRIIKVLSMFSEGTSYGLPVGGAASRLLSELLLSRVDRLLLAEGYTFCRFADDYHIFTDSREAAYDALRFLTEKLLQNEGLTLQRAKTRITNTRDFLSASAFATEEDETDISRARRQNPTEETGESLERLQRNFLALSLQYDPYSPTARDDYESLREQIERFDIIGMLARELSKSRVHTALTRRLLQALHYLDPSAKSGAVQSLIRNIETLIPVFPNVMRAVIATFEELDPETRTFVDAAIRDMLLHQRYYAMVPVNMAYTVRLLGKTNSDENHALLSQMYVGAPIFVQRDIVLIMGSWRATYWLSDQRREFSRMHPWVRRAFIVYSYRLEDEGDFWRKRTARRFSPLERLVDDWAKQRHKIADWSVPL